MTIQKIESQARHDKKPNNFIHVGELSIVYCNFKSAWIFPTGESERDPELAMQMARKLNKRNYALRWKLRNG